jgi:penicillin-binding protein 1A
MTAGILRNVVLHGTGVRAETAVRAGGRAVPLGGKTGTTDDFRNAAFVGFAPISSPGGYRVDGGYAIGAYVGYDDNRPMVNGRIKLSGASGALPAWIGTTSGMAAAHLLGAPPTAPSADKETDPWPLVVGEGLVWVPVDAATGLPVPPRDRRDDPTDNDASADPDDGSEASVLVTDAVRAAPAPRAEVWWDRVKRRIATP